MLFLVVGTSSWGPLFWLAVFAAVARALFARSVVSAAAAVCVVLVPVAVASRHVVSACHGVVAVAAACHVVVFAVAARPFFVALAAARRILVVSVVSALLVLLM